LIKRSMLSYIQKRNH